MLVKGINYIFTFVGVGAISFFAYSYSILSSVDTSLYSGYISIPNGNGYGVYHILGKDSVYYRGNEQKDGHVIGDIYDGRIVSYYMEDSKIAFLRRSFDIENDRFLNKCEYWALDINTHEVFGPWDKTEFIVAFDSIRIEAEDLENPISSGTKEHLSICLNKNS